MLPIASCSWCSPSSRHQRRNSARAAASSGDRARRQLPPSGVAPIAAICISDCHSRSALIVGVMGPPRDAAKNRPGSGAPRNHAVPSRLSASGPTGAILMAAQEDRNQPSREPQALQPAGRWLSDLGKRRGALVRGALSAPAHRPGAWRDHRRHGAARIHPAACRPEFRAGRLEDRPVRALRGPALRARRKATGPAQSPRASPDATRPSSCRRRLASTTRLSRLPQSLRW